MVAPVWDALDSVDLSACESTEDFETALQEVADVFEEVASEYESNEMYDRNPELQERADTLTNSASELTSISFDEEPDPDDSSNWEGHTSYEDAKAAWLETARDAAQEALDAAEVP